MRSLVALTAFLALGCDNPGADLPVQEANQVVRLFASTISACSAPPLNLQIDQAAIAGRGWRAVRRVVTWPGNEREVPLSEQVRLRREESELTEWSTDGLPNRMTVSRSNYGHDLIRDSCSVEARTRSEGEAGRVVAGLNRLFGREPERSGVLPRGGDFLTPRFDRPRYGRYWPMPMHAAYLTTADNGYMSLQLVVMPDRDRLDRYHPDNPLHRIPTLESNS
jgi:hypothetical protein